MKIKTITCQRAINHGANLQAYALMRYLESLGNDVEIIDYYPEWFKPFRPFYCGTQKYASNPFLKFSYICVKLPGRIKSYVKYIKSKRKKNFEAFRERYYKLTNTYNTFDELKTNPPKADLYIAGSDQIWNTMMNNGKDPAYYLQFAPAGSMTATYAASFSVSEIPDELKEQIRKYIDNINFVSLREKSALAILEDLSIQNGCAVLDPVFLLDRKQWEELENNIKLDDAYVLVYDFEGNEKVKRFAIEYAQKHNLKVYSLYKNDYCDNSFEDYGPDVFLSLINNADFIVSNSFHATAFSLIYEKEFAVIKRQEGINSRMVDLLESVGINDRIVDSYQEFNAIDYNLVKDKLEVEVEKSKGYLNRVLESVINNGEEKGSFCH